MTESILVRLFEHNNWANEKIIQVCSILSDEQLYAEPKFATKGSIRTTRLHLVGSHLIFKPDTLLRWHRQGFRLFWKFKSRHRRGRPRLEAETVARIQQMA
ncbi:MAG: hypothetical protein M1570_17185 [Chloroflexi bacterium]|nr:hypothetical protein [Chloroflexota bacterium]